MKSVRFASLVLAVSACVFALVVAVGCSSSTSSATSSASESGASSAASSEASSAASSTSVSTSSASASASASSAASSSSSAVEDAVAQGYQVFNGTVRVCSAEELIKLQGIDIDPAAAGGGGTYAVLVFDELMNVTGESADGSGQRTESCNMLGIAEHTDYSSFVVEYGDLDACKALDGQHATIAAKAQDIVFPSDVSLPIGQPKASESKVL